MIWASILTTLIWTQILEVCRITKLNGDCSKEFSYSILPAYSPGSPAIWPMNQNAEFPWKSGVNLTSFLGCLEMCTTALESFFIWMIRRSTIHRMQDFSFFGHLNFLSLFGCFMANTFSTFQARTFATWTRLMGSNKT